MNDRNIHDNITNRYKTLLLDILIQQDTKILNFIQHHLFYDLLVIGG